MTAYWATWRKGGDLYRTPLFSDLGKLIRLVSGFPGVIIYTLRR